MTEPTTCIVERILDARFNYNTNNSAKPIIVITRNVNNSEITTNYLDNSYKISTFAPDKDNFILLTFKNFILWVS